MNATDQINTLSSGTRDQSVKPPSPLQQATSRAEEMLAVLRKRTIELERVLQPLLVEPMPIGADPANKPEAEALSSPHVGWMTSHAREIASVKTQIESLIGRLQI